MLLITTLYEVHLSIKLILNFLDKEHVWIAATAQAIHLSKRSRCETFVLGLFDRSKRNVLRTATHLLSITKRQNYTEMSAYS